MSTLPHAELTLQAALRDCTAKRVPARHAALRNLAPALLQAIARPLPTWDACALHPEGERVRTALLHAVKHDEPAMAGVAALGLGQLGQREVLAATQSWLEDNALASDSDRTFRRQCCILARAFLGGCAELPDTLRDALAREVTAWLQHHEPDVRFQAAQALIDIAGYAGEEAVVAALSREPHPEVRENMVMALAHQDPVGPLAIEALTRIVMDVHEGPARIGFEAALALAAARQPSSGPRLLQGVHQLDERDRALEGIAVLGTHAPPGTVATLTPLLHRFFLPPVTRVRVAYALCACANATTVAYAAAQRHLQRAGKHPRRFVRQAAHDATAALATLTGA